MLRSRRGMCVRVQTPAKEAALSLVSVEVILQLGPQSRKVPDTAHRGPLPFIAAAPACVHNVHTSGKPAQQVQGVH